MLELGFLDTAFSCFTGPSLSSSSVLGCPTSQALVSPPQYSTDDLIHSHGFRGHRKAGNPSPICGVFHHVGNRPSPQVHSPFSEAPASTPWLLSSFASPHLRTSPHAFTLSTAARVHTVCARLSHLLSKRSLRDGLPGPRMLPA